MTVLAQMTSDALPDLEKITAALVAMNAAGNECNPPETGVMGATIKQKSRAIARDF